MDKTASILHSGARTMTARSRNRIVFFICIFVLSIGAARLEAKPAQGFGSVEVKSMGELSNREISAEVRVPFDVSLSEAQWRACVPRSSIEFPNRLPEDLKERIFRPNELADLMKCQPDSCAFNFSTEERKKLSQLSGEEAFKEAFWSFYLNRKQGKVGISKRNQSHLIRSKDNAFSVCQHPRFQDLLDRRPSSALTFRLSVDDHNRRARPTTRLLQAAEFVNEEKGELCFAEALIFADHYDLDRVEVWSLTAGLIQMQVRQRLDFLHNWIRRIRKPELRKALEDWAESEVKKVIDCVSR